jgi:hypothetical protein
MPIRLASRFALQASDSGVAVETRSPRIWKMNDLRQYSALFEEIVPCSGTIPPAFTLDFLGTLTAKEFLVWGHHPAYVDGGQITLQLPRLEDGENGEFWFEAIDWILSVKEAREKFVMITLGALYGYQAVGCSRALQHLNPMPSKLVAVEPIPENVAWTKRHMRDNGIDPDDHWIIQAVVSDCNDPVFFPVGSPGLGAQDCIATNEAAARQQYVDEIIKNGHIEAALGNLILKNTTGIQKDIIAGAGSFGEIKLVSAITLADILGPLERVDLLEADIQQSEIIVFPPFRHLLKKKVHRIHLGTHGRDVHEHLHRMFADDGWDIVFNYEPESLHETEFGSFTTNDGILSVCNPPI